MPTCGHNGVTRLAVGWLFSQVHNAERAREISPLRSLSFGPSERPARSEGNERDGERVPLMAVISNTPRRLLSRFMPSLRIYHVVHILQPWTIQCRQQASLISNATPSIDDSIQTIIHNSEKKRNPHVPQETQSLTQRISHSTM